MAVNRVERLLRKVSRALESAGIPYAVIGGNAVAAWVATVDRDAVRATKDVDVLVRRDDMAAITAALRPVGLVPVEVLGVVMFVDRRRPSPRAGVRLVFANERIRPHYTHPAPDPGVAARAAAGFRVIDLAELVKMKLQAFRPVDQVHIQDLLANGLIDAALIRSLPVDLRRRLQELQV